MLTNTITTASSGALGGGMELPNKNVRVFITAQFKNAVGNIVNLTGTHGLSVVWSPC